MYAVGGIITASTMRNTEYVSCAVVEGIWKSFIKCFSPVVIILWEVIVTVDASRNIRNVLVFLFIIFLKMIFTPLILEKNN
jgi:hypothetical protein